MYFSKAIPVWVQGESRTMNHYMVCAAALADLRGATLSVTVSSYYRLTVNGRFVAFGPARTARGYARVDVHSLDAYAAEGANEICIECVGYNCRGYTSANNGPAFLLAEIRRGDTVLAATAPNGDFAAYAPVQKLRKTFRYSSQRDFAEAWDYRDGTALTDPRYAAVLEAVEGPSELLPRRAPMPDYRVFSFGTAACYGNAIYDETLPCREYAYSGHGPYPIRLGAYPLEELVCNPYADIQRHRQERLAVNVPLPLTVQAGQYILLDLKQLQCGFFGFDVEGDADTDLAVGYSEYSEDPLTFAYTDINCLNALEIWPGAGRKTVWAFEPYTGRYIMILVKAGTLTLHGFAVREFAHPEAGVHRPQLGDPVLDGIYDAAIRTFCHNAVDFYTDCPSRERAGWLCDSYFSGMAEYHLFGNTQVEDAFLENYRLFRNENDLPEGMVPMCYPAAVQGTFIPQWSMWLVLEIEQYVNERNQSADRDAFRPLVDGLLGFFARYENEDGLLEKLPSWNFVEWSPANSWTQDVNYPTNALYAQMLTAVDQIWGEPALAAKADRIRRTVAEKAFNGQLFVDHAVRGEDGQLRNEPHISEINQYYQILFGVADLNNPKYAELSDLVHHFFGPDRTERKDEIAPANAFIGVYMRLSCLRKLGAWKQALADVRGFFGSMNDATGTLWENRWVHGSLDHGFASYAAAVMEEAVEHLK